MIADSSTPDAGRWRTLVRARICPIAGVDPAREADIVSELAQHAADHCAELVAAGVAEADAIRQALEPLDDPRRVAREIALADRPRPATPPPPAAGGSIVLNIGRDVRYALRLLRRSPGFAAAAIVTLALGIGANAAIFSVVRAVVLRPLPYRDPQRIAAFLNGRDGRADSIISSSLPDYEDWTRQLTSFEGLGLLSGWTFNLNGSGLPERLFGARVTGSLFPLLGTRPLLGRTIEPDDDRADTPEVMVIGYRVWQRLFAGDPAIVGRVLMFEGHPHTVIGVMPPEFRFPSEDTEVWAAIKDNMTGMPRVGRFMAVVGRLKPGVTLRAAQAEVDAVEARLEQAYPESNRGWRVRLTTVHDAAVGKTRPALLTLVAAVSFVLLIACTNVANLLLARATSRARETAVRLALGASRGRIVAQWLTENVLLSLAGGAAGVAIAFGVVRLIAAAGPADVPRLDETSVDGSVLGFTAALSMLAGALPALVPAFRAARTPTQAGLKEGIGGYATAGRGRLGAALIVAEVALAMSLAIAGALLLRSYARLTAVPPGFDPDRVLSLKVFLGPPRYRSVADQKQYVERALDRLQTVAGVESVAIVTQLPIGDPSSNQSFTIEGQALTPGSRPQAAYRAVSPSYFSTMRIPIVRGRGFSDDDRADAQAVVVVNEATARRFWPGADPVGKRIAWATDIPQFDRTAYTIVGVAADVKSGGLDKAEPPAIYAPYQQRVFPWVRWASFVVRTQGMPATYARAVREELSAVDPLQPTYQMASLDDVIAQSVAARRFHTGLIDLFAGLALVLASIGVYSTIGCWVAERAREIGVRMALGADARRILLMVVGRAGALTGLGIVAGALLSIASSRLLATLLYGIEPFDPSTLAAVAVLVALVGIAAAFIPARRAARLDPLTVIRGT